MQYGSPDALKVLETATPVPSDHEILVKIHAATVNRTDCAVLTGKPFIMRLFTGLLRPRLVTTGTDFAGTVEAAGKDVTGFQLGDKVFGFDDTGLASHAEYLVIAAGKAIARMPGNSSFEQAAAGLEGAHYAYNFIRKIKLLPGMRLLLNGATGAIGSTMLQFLVDMGLEVTATCDTPNIDLVRSLGAVKVIDYLKEDFSQNNEKYDVVLDAVGKSTFARCKPLLTPHGIYLSSEPGRNGANLWLALLSPMGGGKKVVFPIPSNIRGSIAYITGMMEKGAFRPVIDRTYPLEQIAAAFTYVASGRKTGNVLVLPGGHG